MADIYINTPNSELTLVFLHGWCLSPDSFLPQINHFKENYSILVPDYSQLVNDPFVKEDLLLLEIIDRIKNQIMELKIPRIIFIGHSMGGILLLTLASQITTAACVIIDTTMPSSLTQRELFGNFLASLNVDNRELQIRNFITNRMFNPEFDDVVSVNLIIDQLVNIWRTSPERFNQLLYQAVLFDSASTLADFKLPLMYIGGTPASGNLEKLKQINEDILIKTMPCGHFIMNNLPQELNVMLEEFIRNYS